MCSLQKLTQIVFSSQLSIHLLTPHAPLTREYRNEKAALIQLLRDLRLTYIFSTDQCQIEHFHIDICDAGKLD
jgi:hypothetical protein